jgi:ABC-type sugar transport system substrate-binding protein
MSVLSGKERPDRRRSRIEQRRFGRIVAGSSVVVLAVFALALLVTAGAGARSGTSAAPPSVGKLLAKAKADVARFRAEPTWKQFGPTLPAPKPTPGLKVGAVTCLWAAPACKRSADELRAAMKAIGWQPIVVDGTADQANQRAALQTFLNEKVAGIIIESIDPHGVADLLAEAKKQGIPFLSHNADPVAPFGGAPGNVGFPTYADGQKLGAIVALHSRGKAKILMLSSTDNPAYRLQDRGFSDYVKRFPGVSFVGKTLYVPFKDLGPPLINQAQAIFQAHPKGTISYVYAPFGAFATNLVQAAQALGRNDIKIVSGDSDLQSVAFIRAGKNQLAEAGDDWAWCSWAAVDMMNRLISGKNKLLGRCPSTLIDKTNIPPPNTWYEAKVDFRGNFTKMWGAGG